MAGAVACISLRSWGIALVILSTVWVVDDMEDVSVKET